MAILAHINIIGQKWAIWSQLTLYVVDWFVIL